MKLTVLAAWLILLAAFSANAQSNVNRPSKRSSIAVDITIIHAPDQDNLAVEHAMDDTPNAVQSIKTVVQEAAKQGRTINVYRGMRIIIPPRDQPNYVPQLTDKPPLPKIVYKKIIIPVRTYLPLPPGTSSKTANDQARETMSFTARINDDGTIPVSWDDSIGPLTIKGKMEPGPYGGDIRGGGSYRVFHNNMTHLLMMGRNSNDIDRMIFLTVTIVPHAKE